MSLSRNFRELFLVPDIKSEKWEDKAFELAKKGDSKELEKHFETANEIYLDENQISTALSNFTLRTTPEKEKIRLLNALKELENIKDVKITKSKVLIETTDALIEAWKLSDVILDLKEEDEDIETENREGNCHVKSVEISKRLGVQNEVVTGYVFGLSDKSRYLHSWVEFTNRKGVEFVIDYTKNIIINKKFYYKINHVIPLSRISDKLIEEDLKKYVMKFGKLGYFNFKEYLVFRDEIIRDFEKNKNLFIEDEER